MHHVIGRDAREFARGAVRPDAEHALLAAHDHVLVGALHDDGNLVGRLLVRRAADRAEDDDRSPVKFEVISTASSESVETRLSASRDGRPMPR